VHFFNNQICTVGNRLRSNVSLWTLSFWERQAHTHTHTHTNVYALRSRYSCILQSPQFEYWQFCFAAGTVASCNHHNLNTDSFVSPTLHERKKSSFLFWTKKCWIIPLSCLKSCTVGVQQHSVRISSNPCTIYKAKKLYFSDVRCKEKLCRIGRLCGSVLIFRLFKGRGWNKLVKMCPSVILTKCATIN